jgi:acyl carrier protein
MEPQDLELRMRAILKSFLPADAPEMDLSEDLRGRFDSLSILEMVFRFEDEFGIEIDTEKLHELKTLGELVRAVQNLVAARETPDR